MRVLFNWSDEIVEACSRLVGFIYRRKCRLYSLDLDESSPPLSSRVIFFHCFLGHFVHNVGQTRLHVVLRAHIEFEAFGNWIYTLVPGCPMGARHDTIAVRFIGLRTTTLCFKYDPPSFYGATWRYNHSSFYGRLKLEVKGNFEIWSPYKLSLFKLLKFSLLQFSL